MQENVCLELGLRTLIHLQASNGSFYCLFIPVEGFLVSVVNICAVQVRYLTVCKPGACAGWVCIGGSALGQSALPLRDAQRAQTAPSAALRLNFV